MFRFIKDIGAIIRYLPIIIDSIKAIIKAIEGVKPEEPKIPEEIEVPEEKEEQEKPSKEKDIIFNEKYHKNIQKYWYLIKKSSALSDGQKIAMVAQSMVETGRGHSELAKEHNNFAGLMWRNIFDDDARFYPVEYTSSSDNITTNYLGCSLPTSFYAAYIKFINRPIYRGWQERKGAKDFIIFLHSSGFAADPRYVEKVSKLFAEAASFLGLKYEEKENPIMTEPIHPPWFKRLSPHKSTRRAKITHIVLHNTDTSTFSSPVYWFINKNSKVSAHAIIPRNPQDSVPFSGKAGEICIPVWEKYAAWHAGVSMYNHKSLGIEIVAGGGLKGMTAWQEDTTIQLIKYWMRKYNIPRENILGHYEVKATSCPGHIWRTADDLNSWINKNF